MTLQATRLEVTTSPADMQDWFESQGFTDGLPVVPALPELVQAMAEGSGLAAGTELGTLMPSGATVTVEKLAINAVMAGCRPAYMPVLVAAVRAVTQSQFNLAAIQATTHPVAPLIMVNGPIRASIGMNSGGNAFGQGNRANATIGRALRLLMINIGGGVPGKTDMSTLGSPAKYGFCAAENEEANPWEPFHVEHGLQPGDSAVLAHASEAPHNVQDHSSDNAGELLHTFATSIATLGSNNSWGGELLIVFGPEHARILANGGLSKNDVRAELQRRARMQLSAMGPKLRAFLRNRRPSTDVGPEVQEIPYFDDPSQILIMVAGGAGLHSMLIPSLGGSTQHVLQKIT